MNKKVVQALVFLALLALVGVVSSAQAESSSLGVSELRGRWNGKESFSAETQRVASIRVTPGAVPNGSPGQNVALRMGK
jgi:hypothetical protein